MQKVKYGVWFHGNELESESICYEGRNVLMVDSREEALNYKNFLVEGVSSLEAHLFSVCEVHIHNNLIKE